jgi:D-3-phosphoglycerate dehydrogenase
VKILIAEIADFSSEVVTSLQKFATVDCRDISEHEVVASLQEYDVFWFRLRFKLTADILAKASRCKIIICPATGLDHIDLQACAASGIIVLSLKGHINFLKNIRATAEHTVALSLSLLRHIPTAVGDTKLKKWNRNPYKGQELYEKSIGILGVGRLGSITANYFKSFGATLFGYDIKEFDESVCQRLKTMNELFRTCDLVSVHVNLTADTHHLIGRKQLECMKPGSWFINTSRGQIVDSEALIHALKSGRLAGAAVDVIENEFQPSTDRLLEYAAEHTNLIVTPHIGGNTYESFLKTEMFMVEQLKNHLNLS